MGFNMKGFNPGRGTGMGSQSQPQSTSPQAQDNSSPFTKKGLGDKKKPPRVGETHDSWKLRNGFPLGIVADLRIWNGKKWVKDERSKAEKTKSKVTNVVKDVKDIWDKYTK